MDKPILILVAGGTASGKTTVVSEIISYFNTSDISVVLMDNYYKRRDDISLEERKKINYDHPNSFDLDLLKKDLETLSKGKTIYSPSYDFTVHNRSNETITIRPSKVIILEGIMAMYDNDIRNLADIKIFVESEADIRFIRRLKREMKERGRSLDEVVNQYLETVKPMHDLYVEPTKKYADIIIPNNDKHDVALGILAAKIKDIIWE